MMSRAVSSSSLSGVRDSERGDGDGGLRGRGQAPPLHSEARGLVLGRACSILPGGSFHRMVRDAHPTTPTPARSAPT